MSSNITVPTPADVRRATARNEKFRLAERELLDSMYRHEVVVFRCDHHDAEYPYEHYVPVGEEKLTRTLAFAYFRAENPEEERYRSAEERASYETLARPHAATFWRLVDRKIDHDEAAARRRARQDRNADRIGIGTYYK